jgi:hypothetical protein
MKEMIIYTTRTTGPPNTRAYTQIVGIRTKVIEQVGSRGNAYNLCSGDG